MYLLEPYDPSRFLVAIPSGDISIEKPYWATLTAAEIVRNPFDGQRQICYDNFIYIVRSKYRDLTTRLQYIEQNPIFFG